MTAGGYFISVPSGSFRVPRAREYLETLPVPPHATVYGMLCASIGETDPGRYAGTELAIALIRPGLRSRVLRTMWRVKTTNLPPGVGENKRPDFQEILTGTELAVFIGPPAGTPDGATLAEQIAKALVDPSGIVRFGALALGESTGLIDEFRPLRDSDFVPESQWVVRSQSGRLALPAWADHVSGRATRWVQCSFDPALSSNPPEDAWVRIAPGGQ